MCDCNGGTATPSWFYFRSKELGIFINKTALLGDNKHRLICLQNRVKKVPVLLSFGGISHKPFSSSCKPFIYLWEMEDMSHKTDNRILMTTENQTTSWEFLECYKNIHKNVMWSPKIHQGTNWRNVEYFVKKVIALLSWKPLGPHLKIEILPMSVFLMFLTSWLYILQKKIVKGYKKIK